MVNTIYKKIKDFIQREWKFLLIIFLLIFITRFPVDCYVITGGGIISATDRVHVTGARKKSGSFNLAYVSELKGTIYTYLLSYIVPSFERESTSDYKYDDSESSEDIEFRNNLLLNQANNNAKYVAYTNANKEIKVKSQSLYVYYISKDAVTDLKVGDKVLEVDGKSFQTFSSLREYINTKSSGEVLSVKVEENGKKKTKSAKLYKDAKENVIYMGVSIMLDKNYEVSPKVDIKFRNSEGGPSGGLMMSLEIYSQLINKDITRGRKIVGTGTISEDGEAGEIDGVKYKLRGAVKNKAQIFIAPSGNNYKEAVKEKKKNNYKIKIIEAKNFKQVLEELAK